MSKSKEHPGIKVLRGALKSLRNTNQGGYDGFRGGRWERDQVFSLHVNPDAMAALFDLVGVTPDEIEINGRCEDCVHSDHTGDGGGWRRPCCSCSRPKMTNFVPLSTLTKRQRTLDNAEQRQLLINYRNRSVWWGTGIVDVPLDHPDRNRQMEDLRTVAAVLTDRGMISDGALVGRCLLMPGKLALDDWDRRHPRRKDVA